MLKFSSVRSVPFWICLASFTVVWSNVASAQFKAYDVNHAPTAPNIDGIVSANEWAAAAPAEGDWTLLRTAAPGDPDVENSRFQMMWDADNLYLLFESDYGFWTGTTGGGDLSFSADNLNLYIDPNTDGEPNLGGSVDGYQLALSQPLGTTEWADTPRFVEDHVNAGFGNQGGPFSNFADIEVVQINGATGGTVEMAIPWDQFNGSEFHASDTGLFHPDAPIADEEWFFNIGRISSDGGNFLPIWQHNDSNSFVTRPDGVITFREALLASDLNKNGFVDFEDLTVLLANWNTDVGLEGGNLVEPLTSVVGFPDLTVLLADWTGPGPAGSPEAALGTEAVPEPSTFVLLALGAMGAVALRRRRRNC
ncbi:MAG: PEP-CTERM sorting domain-containing protein [Planctomycetes bacterium]|nr:PEP-CTERM sorting domain-containing protein [Planctomycetota bacterium]